MRNIGISLQFDPVHFAFVSSVAYPEDFHHFDPIITNWIFRNQKNIFVDCSEMKQTPLCPFVDVNVKCVVYCLQIDEDFKLNFDPDKPIIANKLAANYSEIIVLLLKLLQRFFRDPPRENF